MPSLENWGGGLKIFYGAPTQVYLENLVILLRIISEYFIIFHPVLYPPLPLKPVCTSDRAKFTWTNPLSLDSFDVGIDYITIEAVCLYGNHPLYRPVT